jgi:branched-chain amino acid transport system substrate-binding protein
MQRGTTIRIGVGAPLTGSAAALGVEMVQAIRLAIDEVNGRGGIGGATVDAVVADDKGREDDGAAIARGLCNSDVLAVIGHYNSNVTLPAAPIYQESGVAIVTPIVSNPALTERGMSCIFRFTNRDDATGAAIAWYLHGTLAKRRAVIVETRSTYGTSMAKNFARAFASLGGEVLLRQPVVEGRRDFADLVGALPPRFDVLFYGGSFEGAAILTAMRAAGLDQLFASGDGCWDRKNFLQPAGDAAMAGEGVLVLSACPEIGRIDGSREFAGRYESRFGPIGNYAVNSYDTACAVLAAVAEATRSDTALPRRPDVVAAIRRQRFVGIAYAKPVEWDEKGDNRAAVTALHVVEAGSFRQVAEIAH